MGMTMTQKIFAAHCGKVSVRADELINAKLDLIMGSDVTTPLAIQAMERYGLDRVADPDKIVLVNDHFAPNKDIQAAQNCAMVRSFANKHGIRNIFDGGRMGIEHALLPEKGFVAPGELIIGADSHTCTYGALGAFSTGIGSTDMAAGMVSGESWFRVPQAIRVELTGEFPKNVGGKDLILTLIGTIGVDGARYQSLEFVGDAVAGISIDDRFTICNMAIEAGAKNGIFPVDQVTLDYLKDRVIRPYKIYSADEDAEYSQVVRINLSELKPVVAAPHLPSNVKSAETYTGLHIDQVVIGCCTNGRIGDLRVAAGILRGKKVAPHVRCIVIPATWEVYRQAMREGLIDVFLDAEATVSMPTCGPCNGGHVGVLAANERCVSTTNRNFVGRMGPKNSEIYLASPAVAAASAIAGAVAVPEEEEAE